MIPALVKASHFLAKNNTTIMTALGVVGTIGVAVVASKDTIKARDAMIEYDMEHENEDRPEKEELIARVKIVAPCYIPTALVTAATIAAIVGAHTASKAKITAYSGAYAMAQEAARMYRSSVEEVVSDKDKRAIDSKMANKTAVAIQERDKSTIVVGTGKVLCFDTNSGRQFQSDMETLRKAQNDINFEILSNDWASLNSFYERIGLPPIELGEELGWIAGSKVELKITSTIIGGTPALVINFDTAPQPDFYRKY